MDRIAQTSRIAQKLETEVYYFFNLRLSLLEYANANPDSTFLDNLEDMLTHAEMQRTKQSTNPFLVTPQSEADLAGICE